MMDKLLVPCMRIRQREFERIRSVLEEADPDEPLTAREILDVLEEHGVDFDSAHRVATVLGRHAQTGEVEIIRDQPYRYRFSETGN
jgi:predicted Zn-ribbon and HTH transcriptional regulator